MISPISSIAPVGLAPEVAAPGPAAEPGAFGSVLSEAIRRVEGDRAESRASVERFLAGEPEEIHHLVLNAQKAELSFELFLQVRNKVVQAYQEIMRMPV
jgi:flagellar hook-basal body complex protein FliE